MESKSLEALMFEKIERVILLINHKTYQNLLFFSPLFFIRVKGKEKGQYTSLQLYSSLYFSNFKKGRGRGEESGDI